jgi:carbohydrate-binding DOMON domain-containing protein
MKFSVAAVLAVASVAMAHYNASVAYTTEVVTAYTTYCPGPTIITHSDKTYTITSATTFTITDCPCTVVKPVTTSSVVSCHTCGYNATTPITTAKPTASYTPKTSTVATAGAGKAAALSGAGLAGVLGLAAFVL